MVQGGTDWICRGERCRVSFYLYFADMCLCVCLFVCLFVRFYLRFEFWCVIARDKQTYIVGREGNTEVYIGTYKQIVYIPHRPLI